jgi:hypothetical protein
MRESPDEWLERINSELGAKGIPLKQRPWLAWSEWAKESGQSLTLPDPAVRRIFEWFRKNSKPDSQEIENLYVGAFYYDAELWPLTVPVFYGSAELQALEELPTMPQSVKLESTRFGGRWATWDSSRM